MQWVTVFDLSRDGWLHLWPLLFVLAIAVSAIWRGLRGWLAMRKLARTNREERRFAGPITKTIVRVIVSSVSVILVIATVWSLANLVSLLGVEQHKTYRTIEGRVQDLRDDAKGESFELKGVRFNYSDYDISPCFHNMATHGGPLRNGEQIRVEYAWDALFRRNGIIRLDMGRNQIR
jgi:hypothetical protein